MNELTYEIGVTPQQSFSAVELFSAAYLKIAYHTSNKTLAVTWSGKTNSQELRRGYEVVKETLLAHKPKKWLLDIQRRQSISKEDQRWVFKEVFPNVLRGIEDDVFVAVVLPVTHYHGLVGGLNGDEFIHENNFLIMQHFLYQEEAQRWLNQMHDFKLAAARQMS